MTQVSLLVHPKHIGVGLVGGTLCHNQAGAFPSCQPPIGRALSQSGLSLPHAGLLLVEASANMSAHTPKHFSFAFPATSPPHATLLLLIYIYGLPSWSYSTTVALIEANWTS